MKTHDQQLWSYAADELEVGDQRYLEAHLDDCPECVEQLAAIQVAKEALDDAREARPEVNWNRVDERIGVMVEKRLRAQARRPLYFRLALTGGVAMAAAAALFMVTRERPVDDLIPPGESPPEAWARVDRAQGTSLVNEDGDLVDGTELRGGDVLRTDVKGRAFVHLPDQSHMRVSGATQVALTRSLADDVALTLERGAIAVRASHQQRKGFTVHAGGVAVHVVGTVFGVENQADAVEISVTEGKVRVELPNGDSTFVEAGQRVRFDTKNEKLKRLKVTAATQSELNEVAAVADATTSVEERAMVPASGGSASNPPMLAANGAPRTLPRLSNAEARARQVQAPETSPAVAAVGAAPQGEPMQVEELAVLPPKKTQAPPQVVIPAPVDVWPTIGGGEVIRGVPPKREEPPDEEWASLPAATSVAKLSNDDEVAPAPAPARKAEVAANAPPKDLVLNLEAQFLERATASLGKGECEKFLPGLDDIAQDTAKSSLTENARVLRARCFDTQLRPRQSMAEYTKYLAEYPQGRFTDEARRAIGQ